VYAYYNQSYYLKDQAEAEHDVWVIGRSIIPAETDYYFDVVSPGWANVIPASQINNDPLHQVTVRFNTLLDDIGPGAQATFYMGEQGDIKVYNKTTDDKGEVTVYVQSSVRYKVNIKGGTGNYDSTKWYNFPRDTASFTMYSLRLPSNLSDMFANPNNTIDSDYGGLYDSHGKTFYPQSVIGDVYAQTSGGNYYIVCYSDDRSGLATQTNYTLLTWDTGSNVTTYVGSQIVPGANTSYTFVVAEPHGKNYEVIMEAAQPGGSVLNYYDYTWPGPAWRLPGVPVELYQWISLFLIGAVFLGTSTRLNIGLAGITSVIAAAFIAGSGWMFAWGLSVWPAITFAFIISVILFWKQVSKGEV
jgi:hypothetical protein